MGMGLISAIYNSLMSVYTLYLDTKCLGLSVCLHISALPLVSTLSTYNAYAHWRRSMSAHWWRSMRLVFPRGRKRAFLERYP